MSLYSNIGEYTGKAIELGAGAEIEEKRRESMERVAAIKRAQTQRKYRAISEFIGMGKSIWQNYESNKELMDYAEKTQDFKVESGLLSNIFGSPNISYKGKEIPNIFIKMKKYEDEYTTQRNLFQELDGPSEIVAKPNADPMLDINTVEPNNFLTDDISGEEMSFLPF